MPTPAIKTKIALDGEKEYRKKISEINSDLKVLRSEMDLTTAEFSDQADSVEALSKKNDILDEQITKQKEKIKALEDAVSNAAEGFGEASQKANDWQTSLNNAKRDLKKMEDAQRSVNDALEEAAENVDDADDAFEDLDDTMEDTGETSKGLGDILGDAAGKLGIDLPDGAKKALDGLGSLKKPAVIAAGLFTALATAVFKAEEALIDMTNERAEVAVELSNIARTVNMSVESAQEWDYVLGRVGSSLEDAQGDLSAFQEKILEASAGEGEAAEMFDKLGVAVTDNQGVLRDTESVLQDTINALKGMADETDRNATSSILLGGTGEKLIPLYEDTAVSVAELRDRKQELGVLTEEEIATLGDTSTALKDYHEQIDTAKDKIAVQFAPALEEFYQAAGDGVGDLGSAIADSGIVDMFAELLELVAALAPAIGILADALESAKPIFDAVGGLLEIVSKAVETMTYLYQLGKETSDMMGSGPFAGTQWIDEDRREAVEDLQNQAGEDLSEIWAPKKDKGRPGSTYYVTIDAKSIKELQDIERISSSRRRKDRMETGTGKRERWQRMVE